MKRLGIIGFGNFGRFAALHLKDHFDVSVFDARDVSTDAAAVGVRAVTLREVVAGDVVIFAVPAQTLDAVLAETAAWIRPGALVLDVASVKIKPLQLLERHLPESVEIIGTHPLFGPQSGKNGLAGLRIVLCPVRSARFAAVRQFLEETLGLLVFERTPEEHDREMAYVQGLTHLVARTLHRMRLPRTEQKTVAYQHLLDIEELLGSDSDALFYTIQRENPAAAEVRDEFVRVLDEIIKIVENGEPPKKSQ